MTSGPFLYDEGPAPLHTGTPRRRSGLLLAIFGGTVVVAVLMVLALFLLKGSAEDQAEEAAGVFMAALEQGDTETAHELLCDEERARLQAEDVAAAYLAGREGRVYGAETDGGIVRVRVAWDDGADTPWVVVNEDGPRICGSG
jgi:hypothetical protein